MPRSSKLPSPGFSRRLAIRRPSGRLRLHFRPRERLRHVDDPLPRDISAVAVIGRTLFAACDETATVERLARRHDGDFHQMDNVPIGELIELPNGPTGEMDIEGLAVDGGFLWIAGSHSLKRDKPDEGEEGAQALEALADLDRDPNRWFLGRLPLRLQEDGTHGIADEGSDAEGGAACLKMKAKGRNKLTEALLDDPHLAASVTMPCKENGFDIEGLAVKGDRLLLGLRGPVIRGWTMVLELRVKEKKPGRLKLCRVAADGRRYLKHFLPLAGLGIRDLRFDGDRLLLLAGPTMEHDGIGGLFRWRPPLGGETDALHTESSVERVMDLVYEKGVDQAEGIDFVGEGEDRHLLLVHDSPGPARLGEDESGGRTILTADLFEPRSIRRSRRD